MDIGIGLTATFCHVFVEESPLSLRNFGRKNALFHSLSGRYQLPVYVLELQGGEYKVVLHSHLL